ncbi:bifunctional proline dehydrogenase/L-glutamate gamma-semialdehyde dehydrogenase PutA [Asaia sp. BMEF1]|uniref:bifunctional proline dehydrogenase/L-glutamate gamma-semialdehyde dehydrogenase PutA n=1 Tax=Asaia sp. BMEF1 TaxID=3155932 RepID=UPI003F670A24
MTPFSSFLPAMATLSPSREAVLRSSRLPEAEALAALLVSATLGEPFLEQIDRQARFLATRLRETARTKGVETMVQAFPLTSSEGKALLTLAASLLRIPDAATRDALIRDQIGQGAWLQQSGHDHPFFLNAASWAMSTSSRLHALTGGLRSLAMRSGAPFIRHGVERAITMMGSQFVLADTLAQGLRRSRKAEQDGFSLAYAPLRETARTAEEADQARHEALSMVETLGRHGRGQTLYERPSLSLRLSSLHPRFERSQTAQVMSGLLPFLATLASRAKAANILLIIDAETSETLDLSLDLFDALCRLPELESWNGLGFTVQAYDKRALPVIEHLIALGTETGRRVLLRLVKGAYWDHEIRRSQAQMVRDYPVFTRKCHSDVSYIACARRAIEAPAALYPQFATHNARSIATIQTIAGPWTPGLYEFGCRHGMGETLFAPLAQPRQAGIACRILTPIGPDIRLASFLVRRLIEAGAASSFLNQAHDRLVTLDALIADPVAQARVVLPRGMPNADIPLPCDLTLPERQSAVAPDLADDVTLTQLATTLPETTRSVQAVPIGPTMPRAEGRPHTVINPAIHTDRIGIALYARPRDIDAALNAAETDQIWRRTEAEERAACLDRMAEALEQDQTALLSLLIREAGKTIANAADELREAVDYLRYYAAQLRSLSERSLIGAPLGTILCISPWNFPLASFTGQIAAALAAGNVVIAKPAEETPLIAAHAVGLFLQTGLPPRALQLLPGEGNVGASLVADSRIDGVLFTGSTAVAKTISRELLGRTGRTGQPVPLLADTSGQNAMLVDSTVSPQQVIPDILVSAFDSAGQRSASLRVLLVQEEGADALLEALQAAISARYVGAPDQLRCDMGPVISAGARTRIEAHIDRMRRAGYRVWQPDLQAETLSGHFVAPTLIEIGRVADIGLEVFGPVLHVRRYARHELDGVVDALNATGYALTFGVQSRLRETLDRATARSRAGNIYVNRSIIGASVGMQPFGGRGLSGSGPKLGGPLFMPRLMHGAPCPLAPETEAAVPSAARAFLAFLEPRDPPSARKVRAVIAHGLCGLSLELPAPSGETNRYSLRPKGIVLCACESWPALLHAVGLALGTGNTVLVLAPDPAVEWLRQVSRQLANLITRVNPGALPECDVMLIQRGAESAEQAALTITAREGMVVPVYDLDTVRPEWLLSETVVTTNHAAIGADLDLVTRL